VRRESTAVADIRTAQQTTGNAAVTRVLQRKLAEPDAERLREYYAFLVETRDIAPGAYDKVLERIIERYDAYQDAAEQLSFVLPVPSGKLLPKGGLDAAKFFTEMVKGEGYAAYLAGGSAITLQGGRRPAGDFDFRVDGTGTLKAFKEGEGRTLLNKLNAAAQRESKEREDFAKRAPAWMRRAAPPWEFEPFKVLGVDATMGTKKFFGQEVSLTISDTAVVSHGALASTSGLSMLSLADLLRDKLKTTISRSKRGEDSVKKVAQDLADGLIVAELLTRESTGTPDLSMQGLLATLKTRVPGYVVNNLELASMQGLPDDDVAARMLERLVRTAGVHASGEGARVDKFESLARSYAIDIVEHVERLATVKAPPTKIPKETMSLEEWFQKWNTGPNFAPPKKPDDLKAQPPLVGVPQSVGVPQPKGPITAASAISDVLDGAPDFMKVGPAEFKSAARKVLYVLQKVGGTRQLEDSKDAAQVNAAFGLGKAAFSDGYRALLKEQLVKASNEGLTLTPKGHQYVTAITWA
jgi:hypothetical protein